MHKPTIRVGFSLFLCFAVLAVVSLGSCGNGFEPSRRGILRERLRERLAGTQEPDAETYANDPEYFFEHDGRKRRYLVHVPKGWDRTRSLPVVIGFHGGMGRAETQRKQSRMNEVADRYGFLVVYADGTGRTRLRTFNAGTCCAYALDHKVDDVGYVRKMITKELPEHYPIDRRRIYLTGMSNGAMLCYKLAAELSDLIAAIGPVSGDMGILGPVPKHPVPIIHFHGLKDQNAPFHGGKGEKQFQGNPHRSIPETIAWWVKANGCDPDPVDVDQEKDFTVTRYCRGAGGPGVEVILYTFPQGGHTWPGGVDVSKHMGTGTLISSVSASELMWKFFQRHSLPEKTGASN